MVRLIIVLSPEGNGTTRTTTVATELQRNGIPVFDLDTYLGAIAYRRFHRRAPLPTLVKMLCPRRLTRAPVAPLVGRLLMYHPVVAIHSAAGIPDLLELRRALPGALVGILEEYNAEGDDCAIASEVAMTSRVSVDVRWRIRTGPDIAGDISSWIEAILRPFARDCGIKTLRAAFPLGRAVLLVDIDGTLVRVGGASRRAMTRVVRDVFDLSASPRDVSVHGGTDRDVMEALLRLYDREASEDHVEGALALYEMHLQEELTRASQFRVLPGVTRGLRELRRNNYRVGILTGNTFRGARLKLSHAGLRGLCGDLFGTASDAPDRPSISTVAQRRCHQMYGPLVPTVVIGDSIADVACGRALGALVVAVATGAAGETELRTAGADCVAENFEKAISMIRERF